MCDDGVTPAVLKTDDDMNKLKSKGERTRISGYVFNPATWAIYAVSNYFIQLEHLELIRPTLNETSNLPYPMPLSA
jgi:hypothetical protein